MYDTVQPFIDLANANMAALSRFAESRSGPAKPQAATAMAFPPAYIFFAPPRAEAFVEFTRTTVENYSKFFSTLTNNIFGMVGQGQTFVAEQSTEMSRDFQDGLEEIARAEDADIAAIEVEVSEIPAPATRSKRVSH